MSINVTVTGNPISIKRGKMVTSESYQAKKELEKRRLLRLQQVRQQSKEIAEDVRNKVRREKQKQLRQIEQEGKQKLKSWQNRKLLELQTQYNQALRELGTGHKEAENLVDDSEMMAEQKELSDKIAAHRAQIAATKLQIEKNKENLKKAIPIQKKKLARDVENTRASLISGIKKSKIGSTDESPEKVQKKQIPFADINITIPSSDSETSESGEANVRDIEQDRLSSSGDKAEPSTSSCDCADILNNPRQSVDYDTNKLGSKLASGSHQPVLLRDREEVIKVPNIAKQISERRKLIEDHIQKSNNPPLDTRISDRIKRRELMASQPDYCDSVAKTNPIPFIESNTQLRDAVDARNINNAPIHIDCICGHKCPKICGAKFRDDDTNKAKFNENDPMPKQTRLLPQNSQEMSSENEIPEKPPIRLKEYSKDKKVAGPSRDTLQTYDSHKVSYYDHPNRFSHEKRVPSTAHVEKITLDSLEVVPNSDSEEEWQQKMKQRDREAQVRGQKALEKERIQKDYEEMLKKLPLLQKKERISEITKDKQEYHMSEERLKERDRKRQNELDNAYSKLFPNLKPAVVTLPSKKPEKEAGKLVNDEPIQSLNVGNWDVDQDEPKLFTAEEVQEIVKAFTEQKPKDRRAKLKQLLRSLKLQKEQLISEMKSLPVNDSINQLISDLNSFSDSDEKSTSRSRKRDGKSDRKRRREEHDKEISTDSTTESSSSVSTSKHGKGKMKDKHKKHSLSGKTPSPRKKPKRSRRKVLILQNMSTQTTPKASSNSDQNQNKSEATKSEENKPKSAVNVEKPVCPKLHVPCDCNKENESTDEVCQIVIKINENEDPEVVVKSKEKHVRIPEITAKEKSPKHKKTESKSVAVGTADTPKPEKVAKGKVSSETQTHLDDRPKRIPQKKSKSEPKVMDSKKKIISEVDRTESKAKSWREQLSKNSISTSSTSYFSPPDFHKSVTSQSRSGVNDQSKQSLYNLHKKPQQNNLRDISVALSMSLTQSSLEQGAVDPKLLAYIQKLLSMSRGSIENLTVSSSSVQTPSQSVIEMESNNPLSEVHKIIKNFNLKDIANNLSYSSDYSPIHPNTSASASESSQPQLVQEKGTDLGEDHLSKSGKTDHSSKGTIDKETSSCSAQSKDSILAQYADITDSCSKRIAQLAAMIEKIREEKIQMLQNPPAVEAAKAVMDKDYSTAYLDLPGSNDSSSKYSSLNSLDDDELQRRLLEIDFSLAEKLRKFSTKQDKVSEEDIGEKENAGPDQDAIDDANNTNTELWSRLNRLTQQQAEQEDPKIFEEDSSFVPFLSDIPKLPKLEVQPDTSKVASSTSLSKRPPPSKGLSIAKKYNGNISLVPHELSTIVEADSQLSTKIGSANNSRTSQDISPRKDFELVMQPEDEIAGDTSTSKHSSKSNKTSPSQVTKVTVTPKKKCADECTNICSQIVLADKAKEKSGRRSRTPPNSPVILSGEGSVILSSSKSSTSKKSVQVSSSSSDDVETIESMLKSIGMDWAIPTLHKTKEALALTSSSSSLELSAKKQITNSSSGSEVSLKQYLKKQIKISSSTFKSDGSPASFSADLSELSSIQANNSNVEKSNQRTSTPVISSKSTERSGKKVVFSEGSDISSVREHSDKSSKLTFHSLSESSQSKSDT